MSPEVIRASGRFCCEGDTRPDRGCADGGAELLWEYGGGGWFGYIEVGLIADGVVTVAWGCC